MAKSMLQVEKVAIHGYIIAWLYSSQREILGEAEPLHAVQGLGWMHKHIQLLSPTPWLKYLPTLLD